MEKLKRIWKFMRAARFGFVFQPFNWLRPKARSYGKNTVGIRGWYLEGGPFAFDLSVRI